MARNNSFWLLTGLVLIFAGGLIVSCGGGGGGSSNNTNSRTYTLSGTVSGPGMQGVTITVSSAGTTTTNAGGAYSFSGLTNGTYTITASKPSYTFTPASQVVAINNANAVAPSFVSEQLYSISGKVADGSTVATPGVTMTLSATGLASAVTATTDGSGNYTFGGMLSGASYTVTPAKAPSYDMIGHTMTTYAFSPANFTGTVASANVIGVDFVTTATITSTYSVSGKIVTGTNTSLGGQPYILSSVAVKLSDPSYINTITAITDGIGNYSFDAVPNGSYLLWVPHFSTGSCPNPTLYSFVMSTQTGTVNPYLTSTETVTVSGANVAIGDITENVSREGCAHPVKPDVLIP